MKPIAVIYLHNAAPERIAGTAQLESIKALHTDYHVLVLNTNEPTDVKVFYEKDMIELDKEQLSKLLNAAGQGGS